MWVLGLSCGLSFSWWPRPHTWQQVARGTFWSSNHRMDMFIFNPTGKIMNNHLHDVNNCKLADFLLLSWITQEYPCSQIIPPFSFWIQSAALLSCSWYFRSYQVSELQYILHQNLGPPITGPLRSTMWSCDTEYYGVPSGKQTVCYWKWPFIVSFPIKNGDFP